MRIMRATAFLICAHITTALALSPAPQTYPYTLSTQDTEQLNSVACVQPHSTQLEEADVYSTYADPKKQLLDLRGSITCSPYAKSDGIIWRNIAFCKWDTDHWRCKDERTIAEFYIQNKKFKIDFYNGYFTQNNARKIFKDILGLGSTKNESTAAEAIGPCTLDRSKFDSQFDGSTIETISLDCENKVFDIDEHCDKDKCHYTQSYSYDQAKAEPDKED